MCRPTKLTPELQAQICRHIADGNYIETACNACGISSQTYRNWKEKAECGKQPFMSFMDDVKTAEAQAELNHVAKIKTAGILNWQASAWFLERKYPDRWGKKETIKQEHSGTLEVKSIFQELADLQNVTVNEQTSGEDT